MSSNQRRWWLGLGLCALALALAVVAGLNDWGWVFVLAFGWAAGERWMHFWWNV